MADRLIPTAWDRAALLALPAFAAFDPALQRCPAERFPTAADLTRIAREQGLCSGGGVPLRFVAPPVAGSGHVLPGEDLPYEVRIFRHGEVPTRPDNYHDLFNALAWLTFPQTKAALNRRHHEYMGDRLEQSAQGEGGKDSSGKPTTGSRGVPRDVLTLFDESGMIVVSRQAELMALLRGFAWKALFVDRRAEVLRAMRFLAFGHAVLEKMLNPYKGITAKALLVEMPEDWFAQPLARQIERIDARVAAYFSGEDALAGTATLSPLPVMGIPGWCTDNTMPAFYDDESVFRPGRRGRDRRSAA